MRSAALLLAAVLAAGPAHAAEKKDPSAVAHYVDISMVALPIVWQGRVVNYVFASVRVNLAPRIDAAKLREKEPYLRDALVRAGHRAPFTRPWDFTHLDERALATALRPDADRIAGPGAVTSIQVMSQTPRQTSGLPERTRGAPAAAAPTSS
ncbi:MAG: hypothetical protein INR64_06705 [Caulobacteraceae bacterium]|nr:hypothetical protein [Caulobacter sp.]